MREARGTYSSSTSFLTRLRNTVTIFGMESPRRSQAYTCSPERRVMADLFHSITIEAKPNAVYAAVATQKGMRGWWTADTTMQAKPGGKVEFGFEKSAVVFSDRT